MPEVSKDEAQASQVQTRLIQRPAQDLGEVIEEYLARTEETGHTPELEAFLAEYSQFGDELRSAIEGLALMQGLLSSGSHNSRVGHGAGLEPQQKIMLRAGSSLAGYRIVRELGRGGMGVVYEAVHVDLDRPVALKVLKPWSGGSARRRFLNEARTSAALHHTNIVPVFDVGQSGDTSYYAMQKIDGEGLDRLIRRLRGEAPVAHPDGDDRSASTVTHEQTVEVHPEKPAVETAIPGMPQRPAKPGGAETGHAAGQPFGATWPGYDRWVAQIGSQAAMALDYAHKRQVIHRDIKPSNLILDRTGTIWVADFGLALRLDDPGLSRGDGVLGTPRYTSPEQAARKVVDHRTDIYSLGATLYELVTGRPAFDGDSSDEVIRKILTEPPAPPREIQPLISRDFETIILKAMARRPEDRYATGAELADDLARFLNFEPVKARRIGPAGRLWRLSRRHPAISAVTIVSMSLIIGITAFAYRRVVQERDEALAARLQTQLALNSEKKALEQATSAMRNQLWREASLVRLSAVPNRRNTILGLVQEAAGYGPEPALRPKLRDEVVEALSLSDVRPELPLVPERVNGFEVISQSNRAVTISEDGKSLVVWDLNPVKKHAEVALEKIVGASAQPENRDWFGRGSADSAIAGGMISRRMSRTLVAIGPLIGILRTDGLGIAWVDTDTAEPRGEWRMPDAGLVMAVQAVGTRRRILTVEYHPDKSAQPGSGRNFPNGPMRPTDEVLICLHDLEKPESKPIVLERMRPTAERGRFFWPVVSVSPDGAWVAVSKLFDDQIRILDTTDGHELASLSAQVPVSSIAAGPQRLLAIAGGGSIRLWRNEIRQENGRPAWTSTALPTIGTHLGTIRQIRFAGDRNMIAASGRTSGIELWDVDSGEAVATLATSGQADQLAFSKHGELLLASMDDPRYGGLRAWSIDEPIAKSLVGNSPEPVVALGLQAGDDVQTLFAQTLSGQVWYEIPGDGPMRPLRLADGNDRFSAVRTDQQGRLWTLLTDRSIQRWDKWRPHSPHLVQPTESFQLPDSSDGGWAMRGFGLTRMPTGLVFAQSSGRTFTSRGPMLYLMDPSVGTEFTPISLDSAMPQPERQPGQEKSDRRRPQPGGDRERGDRDRGQGQVPPARPGENLAGLGGFRNAMPFSRRLNVSPGGERMAILRGDTWEFWDLGEQKASTSGGKAWSAEKRPVPTMAPQSGLTAMAMSPDGALLALATREGVVTLVNVPGWRVVSQFQAYTSELAGANPISDLSFMPGDRSMLAVASRSQIAIWDLDGPPARYLSLPVDSPSATPMIWEPNGQGLYLVEEDKRIIRWDLGQIFQKIESLGLLKK